LKVSPRSRRRTPFALRATIAWPLAAVLPMIGLPAFAATLPTGANVVAGKAVVTTPGPNAIVVKQATPRAVVDWTSFNIGEGASVSFSQPGIGAATLNVVTGNAPSVLAGALKADGSAFLVNRNGIEVTTSGRVDVGSAFVASTLPLDANDFMNGTLSFSGQGGAVVNRGRITTGAGGAVALLGGSVDNEGVIEAPLGRVGLGSAAAATLDLGGDGFLQVLVPAGTVDAQGQALVTNGGTIAAEGGTVELRAATVRAAMRLAVNVQGTIRATSVSGHDGAIVLDGGRGGAVQVAGTLDASAAAGVADGGRVDVGGGSAALQGATIAASGDARGGLVRIGGAFQGGKAQDPDDARAELYVGRFGATPSLANAAQTTVDATSTIDVSARGANGTGGTAVVWSDRSTTMQGTIVATGASAGGAVEISSASTLHAVALARVRVGVGGALLVDPADLVIGDDPMAGPTTDDVIAQLQAGTNVSLQANEDITWSPTLAHPAIVTPPSGNAHVGDLALSAGRSIMLSGIFETGGGTWSMTANDTAADGIVSAERGTGLAAIDLRQANFINTNGRLQLSLLDGTGNAEHDADGIFLGSYGGEGITAAISPSATGLQPTRILVTHSLSTADDIVLTGNLQISGQTQLTTLSAPHVTWTDEDTGATIHGEGSLAFVENGVMTRYGTLIGVNATRLDLGDPAVTNAARVYGDADPGVADLGSPMLHVSAQSTTPAADPLANLLQSGSIATTGPGTTANVGHYTLGVGASGSFAFNFGLQGGYWVDLAPVSLPLTVTQRHLTPTVSNGNTTYGSPLSVVSLANIANGDAVAPVATLGGTTGVALQAQGGGFGFAPNTSAGTTAFSLTGLAGSEASNYVLALGGTVAGTLVIAPKALTWGIASGASQTYGTLPSTPLAQLSGVLPGDDVAAVPGLALNGTPVAYGARTPVGTYDAGVTGLGGASASNYTLAPTGNTVGTLTVSPKALAWSVASTTTTYGDGGSAGAAQLAGVLAGDEVTGVVDVLANGTPFTPGTGTHAGAYGEVVAGLGGAEAGNYVLASTGNANGTYTVSPRLLTLASPSASQVYGGVSGGLAVPALDGLVNGDQVGATQSITVPRSCLCGFNGHDWTVGAYFVNLSGLTGASAADYTLGATQGYAANVTPRTLTWSSSSGNIVYGDTTSVSAIFGNVVPGDTVTTPLVWATDRTGLASTTRSLLNVGNYTLSVRTQDLSDNVDYIVPLRSTDPTLAVAPKPLTWQVGNGTAVYGDGFAGSVSLQGIVDNATPVAQLEAVDSNGQGVVRPGVGNWSVSVASLSGPGSANYTVTATGSIDGLFAVTPRPVTWNVATSHSFYGDSLTPGSVTYGNAMPGDDPGAVVQVQANGTPLSSSPRSNAGAYQEIVTGLANPNYVLASSGSAPGEYDVWKRLVTFSVPDASSTYGAAATLGVGTIVSGVLPGDVVGAGSTALQATGATSTGRENAGVWALDMRTLTGADAGNYTPNDAGSTLGTLTIAPKPVTYTMQGTFQFDLPFTNRTTNYGHIGVGDLPQGRGTVNGALAGDDVGVRVVGPASMPLSSTGLLDVGSYTFSGGALTGAAAGNYVIQSTGNANATLQIQPQTLHITPIATSLVGPFPTEVVYGSTAGLIANGIDTNFVNEAGNDKVTVDSSAMYFSLSSGLSHTLPNGTGVGSYSIVASGNVLKGADAGNYTAVVNSGALWVFPRPVTVTVGQASPIYGQLSIVDGVANYLPDATINGMIHGDDLLVTLVTYAAPNGQGRVPVGTYAVTASGLAGTAASNYTLSTGTIASGLPPTTAGSLVVTRALLTFDQNQFPHQLTYGQTIAAVDVAGVLPGDGITVTNAILSASDPTQAYAFGSRLSVGQYAYTLSLAGPDRGDYQLVGPFVADYTVTPKAVTVSLSPLTRTYGTPNPAGDGVSVNGVLSGDTLVPALTASANGATAAYDLHTDVGQYTVHASGLAASPGGAQANYVYVDVPGATSALTITPRPLHFVAPPSTPTAVYGDAARLGELDGVVASDDVGLQATLSGGAPTARLVQDTSGGVWYALRADAGTYNWSTALAGARAFDYTLATPPSGSLAVTQRQVVWAVENASAQHGGFLACDPTTSCDPWVSGMPLGAGHLQNVLAGDTVSGTVIAVDGNGTPIPIDAHTPVGAYFEVVSDLTGTSAHNYQIAPSGSVPGLFRVTPEWISYATSSAIYLPGSGYVGTPGAVTLNGPGGPFSDPNLVPVVQVFNLQTGAVLPDLAHLQAGRYAFRVIGLTGADAGDFQLMPASRNKVGTLDAFTSTGFGLGLTGTTGLPPAPVIPSSPTPPAADPLPPLANYYASQDANLDPEFGRNITRNGAGGGPIVGLVGSTVVGGASGVTGTNNNLGGGVDLSTQASGEATGLVKWGVKGLTLTATADAHVDVELQFGPGYVEFGAQADSSANALFTGSGATLTLNAQAQATAQTGVSGDLGDGATGAAEVNVGLLALAHTQENAGFEDDKLNGTVNERIGVGFTAGGGGSVSGAAGSVGAGATVYSPGMVGAQASTQMGLSGGDLTVALDFGAELGFGGFELKTNFSINLEAIGKDVAHLFGFSTSGPPPAPPSPSQVLSKDASNYMDPVARMNYLNQNKEWMNPTAQDLKDPTTSVEYASAKAFYDGYNALMLQTTTLLQQEQQIQTQMLTLLKTDPAGAVALAHGGLLLTLQIQETQLVQQGKALGVALAVKDGQLTYVRDNTQ
jgi:filamentous hemagglutinin family protein